MIYGIRNKAVCGPEIYRQQQVGRTTSRYTGPYVLVSTVETNLLSSSPYPLVSMTRDTDEAPRTVTIDQMLPLSFYIKNSPNFHISPDTKADGGSHSKKFESTLEVSRH